jgi:hypothetical protein
MAEFLTNCPTCGFSFSADESHAGLTTSCASCSREFVIQLSDKSSSENFSTLTRPDQIQVTSSDLHAPYEIIGMVCITLGTRGEMKNIFESLKAGMANKLSSAKSEGQLSREGNVGQYTGGVGIDSAGDIAFSGQYAGSTFNSRDLDLAFHVAVNQLQLRASYLDANAIIGFRYNIDFDSNASVLNFMATAFGTAVRLSEPSQA